MIEIFCTVTNGSLARPPIRQNSASSTPRMRPTTLDIPGLTKSKVSPDGRISERDVGSKLVIIMVGLPARGKSYITKKMARYLNWLQHDTKIFNVGERRRVAALSHQRTPSTRPVAARSSVVATSENPDPAAAAVAAAKILVNGTTPMTSSTHSDSTSHLKVPAPDAGSMDEDTAAQLTAKLPELAIASTEEANGEEQDDSMDQSAAFFDPSNKKASQLREQVALETLEELLDYVLLQGGSVGIFDATNSTLQRRELIMKKIRERAGEELNVLFIESICKDENLLENNMRLKLSGPDYKDKDPVAALADFKQRVAIYEKNYAPIGDYEEKMNMPYVQMVDVGRKVITHQIRGFLSAQAVYYLLNFNLAPRMIWISRHGESLDNVAGKIGGDSDLSPAGRRYAQAMTRFVTTQRHKWETRERAREENTHWPPRPGDHTPPNPHYSPEADPLAKNFCVWTSMLKRSVQSAEYFDEEQFEAKQMRMLDELNSGHMEGMTYEEIRKRFPEEYHTRLSNKLMYRYPGPGGEGYLDVINRLRPVIVELERMTDHCLLVTHRSVARVLLAYFMGLKREDVAELDCPLGMLYQLEPVGSTSTEGMGGLFHEFSELTGASQKPYGVEFRAYRYNPDTDDFEHCEKYQLRRQRHLHGV